jgi:hypothetical protein
MPKVTRIGFTTFLKLLLLNPDRQFAELEKYTSPGGYDYYARMKKAVRGYALDEHSFDEAKGIVEEASRSHERKNALSGLKAFEKWKKKAGVSFVVPPTAEFSIASDSLKVRVHPEIAYDDGEKRHVTYLWNTGSPSMTRLVMGLGTHCLRKVLAKKPGFTDAEFHIFNLRNGTISDAEYIPNNASVLVRSNIASLQVLWEEVSGN